MDKLFVYTVKIDFCICQVKMVEIAVDKLLTEMKCLYEYEPEIWFDISVQCLFSPASLLHRVSSFPHGTKRKQALTLLSYCCSYQQACWQGARSQGGFIKLCMADIFR